MAPKNDKHYFIHIRLSKQMDEEFKKFCDAIGQSVSGAVMMLVKATIKKKKIPFTVEVADIELVAKNSSEQTRIVIPIEYKYREAFFAVCKEIHVPASRVVKMFMLNCIKNGKLPF